MRNPFSRGPHGRTNKRRPIFFLPNSNEEKVNGSDDPDRRKIVLKALFFFIYLLVYSMWNSPSEHLSLVLVLV